MKSFKKILATVLCVIMVFGSAPLSGLIGLDLPEFNLFTPKASAATYSGTCGYTGDDIRWTLDTETGVLTITGHGGMKNFNNTNSYNKDYMTPWVYYDYEIYVKSVVVSEGITSIGDDAFGWLPNLSNVSLPSTLTRIGSRAFYDCDSLKSIEIPESVKTIDHDAFYHSGIYHNSPTYAICVGNWMVDTRSNYSGPASVTIPDGIENIANYAFSGSDDEIRIVYIPQSVKYIGYRAFWDCTATSYYYAGDVEDWCTIDMYDQYSSPMIKTTSIYFNNALLEEIIIPDGVTEIKKHVFANMTNINNISIPDSVTSIGKDAFYNTGYYNNNSNWENGALYIDNHLIKANNSISESYNIKDGTICIADYACYNLSAPKVIKIPSSVKTIGEWAFTGCTSLTRVIMNEGLERIGNGAFAQSKLITSFTIPSSVKYIGDYAFQLCEGMTSFTFADNSQLSYLGIAAFANCKALTEISLPDGITEISDELFSECVVLKSVNMPDYITKIGDKAFYNCNKLDTVTIPNGTKSIGDNAFAYCYYLPNITLPDSLELLGNAAFYHCSNSLTQIIIPGSVKIISEDAFYRCYALTSVSINEGTETIRTEAFMSCSALSEINLPDSIIAIEKNAFYDTKYYGNNSNWVDGKVLYIDNHLIQANTSISGDYNVASGTKSIADYAFNGCASLTGINVPEGLVAIGDCAFNGCSAVETIYLPSTIKTIGEYSCEEALYLNDVHYNGGEKDWENIEIASNNAYLLNAYLHFAYHYITWVVDGTETTERIAVGDTVNVPADPAKDYYTFSGWDKQAPATMPEKDYVITAKFTPITYNATFVIDGETFATVPYTVETESIENPVLPKRDGYTEIWEDYTLTPGGITVDAIYTVIVYNAVFTANDKTVSTIPYTVETASITPPAIPEKAGYTSKWADYTLALGGVTINAIYTPITYYATFVIDGETVAEVPYTVETRSIVEPTLPVREGYTERWEDYKLALGGITINAIYSINSHTVTWIVDGKKTVDTYNYGDTIVKPADPKKVGYTFTGWGAEIPATVPDKDLTFTANWKVNSYTVTWNVDGVTTTETYNYGASINKPANPVKEGYTFIGWNNDVPSTMPANNLELVAEWSINPHTVTWNVDGKKTVDTYNYGDTIVKPVDPEKVGYTFNGWGAEIPATVPDKDLTFTANWKFNNYTVTWNVDGVTTTETYNYGESINKPANPVKEGYTFIGWNNDVPSTMPAETLEFVAEWAINPHTVTWIVDGKKTVDTYNYGDTIVKPADPEKVGYTFNGWGTEIPVTVPDKDLTFTANWKVNNYTVIWNVDGVITEEYYDYGAEITAPVPEKDGYFFIGWDKVVPSTMPAESLEFVAQWSKVEYEFEFDGNGIIINSAINASGDVEIPAIINGYPVIAIDEYAFAGSDVTSVTIPEGVESIGWFAFGCCDKLETVNIPSSVTDIDYGAFSGCSNIETINISADNNNFVTDEYGVVYTKGFIDLVYAPAKSVGEAYAMRSTATYIYPFAFSDCSDFALTISDNLSDEDADEFLLYISVNEFITNDSCINFKAVDGVLYNKAVTKLYKYPVDNKREFYALPSSVTTIADEFAFVCVDKAFYLFVDEDVIIAGVDEIFKTPENLTLHIDYASEFTADHFTMTLFGPAHVCVGDITKADADALNENAEEIIAELEEIWNEIEPELTPGTDEYDFMKAYVLGYIDMITNYVDCENDHTRLHKYAAVVEKDEGDCTNDGCTNYKCVCGYEFTEVSTAPGHNYVAVVTAPTCTKAGYTTYTCSACNDTYTDNVITAEGHKYESVVTDPTCMTGGYTTHTCSVCGDSYVDDKVSATGHSHESKVTKEPTCTTTGIKTFTCHCGDSYTEIIKANGHTKGEWEYIGGKEYAKNCTVCGDKLESKIVTVNMTFNGENVNRTQILNKSTATVVATVTDNFTNNLVFASSDDSIVSIDANGNIIANDVGKATVTVTISGTAISDSIEVEVLPRDFTITWNVNGKVTKQTIKEYASITPNVDTKRPGYKFVGWDSEVPSTMPAKNLSFTAKFELSFKMSISKPSTTTISYGDSIILHADMNEALPSGWTVKWTADNSNFSYSANGETCTITPSKSGDTTFTATVYDENGNEISKDTQTMKSKAGFFDKFAAFFRKLFGMTKIIQQSINF